LEAIRIQEEEEKERAKEAARQRVLEDFEKGQLGLGAVHIERKKKAIDDNNTQGLLQSLLVHDLAYQII